MKIYQEWMLTSWLLLYFTKPQVFAHQTSWSTVRTRHDMKTAVDPRNSQHNATKRTNFTTSAPKQINLLHSKEHAGIWPFVNYTSSSSSNKHEDLKESMFASGDSRWSENLKNSPTFFYTHVEPHRFEYRAMFQHNQNDFKPENFHPFVNNFPPFPKVTFPPFPKFPSFPEIFEPRDQPEAPPFHFPTVPPSIRRILTPTIVDRAVQIPRPISRETFDGPLKKYDVVLGNLNTKYPKIFRFNEERMNIVDFEKQKKLKLGGDSPNSISGPEYVPREQFLILHGGIFTVQEPPLYNQHTIRKRKLARQSNFYKNADD